PLLIPRTAATTNPYSFAVNDPINRSDPSGLVDNGLGSSPTSILSEESTPSGAKDFVWKATLSDCFDCDEIDFLDASRLEQVRTLPGPVFLQPSLGGFAPGAGARGIGYHRSPSLAPWLGDHGPPYVPSSEP